MTITAIAPAIASATAYRDEDEAITKARAILAQAGGARVPQSALALVGGAIEAVRDAIEIHEALRKGVLGWEAYDTDLLVYAADSRHDIAVRKSAEDAGELAGYLAELLGRYATGEQA
jgi:hypothetical protein